MNNLLYNPKGRASEYGKWAANIYKGCVHGCRYCFAPDACHVDREAFHDEVMHAPNVLARLERDLRRVGKLADPIFLCFTCDPYPPGETNLLTRDVIRMINESGNTVNLLTKGGMRAARDFDLLVKHPGNKVGATLTFSGADYSEEWEPGAAPPDQRLLMLAEAKERGIQTWASIEPVIMPSQSLFIMESALPFVDHFKIGKWNHDRTGRADKINWRKFLDEAESLMKQNGKAYTIKEDLIKAAELAKS